MRTRVILAGVAIVVVALAYDWHLYLFDRVEYLIRRHVAKCVAATMADSDFNDCRTIGFQDERCLKFKAIYVEKAGECEAARIILDAEIERQSRR
jgi:hypothetical protein